MTTLYWHDRGLTCEALERLIQEMPEADRLLVTALILPACGSEWRNRAYAFTLVVAVVVAVLLALPWPLALHARDPALFAQWWASESLDQYLAMLGAQPSAASR